MCSRGTLPLQPAASSVEQKLPPLAFLLRWQGIWFSSFTHNLQRVWGIIFAEDSPEQWRGLPEQSKEAVEDGHLETTRKLPLRHLEHVSNGLKLGAGIVDYRESHRLQCRHSVGVQVQLQLSHVQSSSLLVWLEGQRRMAQVFGPLHPCRRPDETSTFSLAQPQLLQMKDLTLNK